ncbi:hypothetical protein NP554_21855 [Pseudomonas asiatica]|uniref:Uncharacterized protein n=1 Tax=Pseudomonas asiatica TaxID=2219225 RepID=A0A9X4D376_9PSED|nr:MULTISPECIES: hypothetical protein [Pseudomonas]MDD2108737.1 hypothetical protein [Pseudomonas asiatica]MDD2114431.1 hypothetical protein [Pseudomonas asiatica]OUS78839.1 hypothetical protein CBP05_28415 [Pseudomonas putida]OUS87487.1 hypothetical protein CBP06_15135 [Pseudomonas putida]
MNTEKFHREDLDAGDSHYMTGNRINVSYEVLLWRIALDHFGPEGLHQVVVELWRGAGIPPRKTVEHIKAEVVGEELLNILKIAQIIAGGLVPYRQSSSDGITLYSRHAQHLVDGLLERLPVEKLPRALRVARLQNQIGL